MEESGIHVMPCSTAVETQALRRRAAAAHARFTAADASRSRPVTTMADGARLRPAVKVAPVGADQARAVWALAQADMVRLDARREDLRERAAGIASALRLMGRG